MNTAVAYHWWSLESDSPPHQNIRVPIIGSIATLRAVDKTIPIYVLDCSDHDVDWHGYDKFLNFKIIKTQFFLKDYRHRNGWQNLSRIFDLRRTEIPEKILLYSDSDVFWIKSPLPLEKSPNKFCFNGTNSGLFYFDKTSPDVAQFFNLFEAFTITALNDESFRIITRQYTGQIPFFVIDEQVLTYMHVKMRELFNTLDIPEHFTLYNVTQHTDLSKLKNLHLHAVIVENPLEVIDWKKRWNRGATLIFIQELYDLMNSILSETQVQSMFDHQLMEFAKIHRTSFVDLEFQNRFLKSKDQDGHYHLLNALKNNAW